MINEKSELLFCLDSNASLMNAANMLIEYKEAWLKKYWSFSTLLSCARLISSFFSIVENALIRSSLLSINGSCQLQRHLFSVTAPLLVSPVIIIYNCSLPQTCGIMCKPNYNRTYIILLSKYFANINDSKSLWFTANANAVLVPPTCLFRNYGRLYSRCSILIKVCICMPHMSH